jgi:iron(III) transport system permease protein
MSHPSAAATPPQPGPRLGAFSAWRDIRPGVWLAGALVLAFLLLFLVLPVGQVFVSAFVEADGSPTLGHFSAFFSQSLMKEAFFNSLYVALMSTLFSALIAIPLAYFTVRFDFRGAILIQTLGVLPLIMPPFVGAVAMQLIFGRSGSVNLLLNEWFGFTLPIMEGLNGVIFVEAIHYFPFILMNLTVALRNIDGAMEEAAMNLGCRGWRLFWRVIFPLACRALWPALRWCSSRSSTTWARRWCWGRPTCWRRRPTCASPRSAWKTRWATSSASS